MVAHIVETNPPLNGKGLYNLSRHMTKRNVIQQMLLVDDEDEWVPDAVENEVKPRERRASARSEAERQEKTRGAQEMNNSSFRRQYGKPPSFNLSRGSDNQPIARPSTIHRDEEVNEEEDPDQGFEHPPDWE